MYWGIGRKSSPARPAAANPRSFRVERLFLTLTAAVEGSLPVALIGALAWGVVSVLLSPCHLASIPLVIGFVQGQGRVSGRRALGLSLLFSAGILITIAMIGGATALAGRLMGDLGPYANYFVAALFFVVGLHLLGVFPLPGAGTGRLGGQQRRGAWAALLLGLLFGVALGPCTFAFLAPMLGVVFRLATGSLAYGILLLLAYAIGHCGVIALAGASSGWVQNYLDWSERSRGARRLRRACGLLVILAGLYMIWSA
ncbi:MAG: cytochrome C biogenesis protein [Candidatus Eisenbacteria bacterium]|nr:cytochrome C biogenesis protein [Candidatus Eisenbacteria bacterium]